MDYKIRPARPQDVPAIAVILRSVTWMTRVQETAPEELHQQMLANMELCLADDSHTVLVAEDSSGNVRGFASVHWLPYFILKGPEGYVSELFVHETARGEGIGTLLLEAVKVEARRRGCTRLMLVNGRNRPSYQREFYKKNGWRERDHMANFVFDID
jgi:GNAT superfamily N-acetyltransferase